jgi:dihydrofolate reductase
LLIMIISLVVAAAENNAIGKDNKLLWHLPNDLKFFKNLTWAFPVIMGRKTFESFGKPLAGRRNIVITRHSGFSSNGVHYVKNLADAVMEAQLSDVKEIFIIGGGQIYKEAMPIAHRIYITRVHAKPDADTYFPEIDEKEWKLVKKEDHEADEKHKYAYSFQVWDRK